jgi:hypothetical protein
MVLGLLSGRQTLDNFQERPIRGLESDAGARRFHGGGPGSNPVDGSQFTICYLFLPLIDTCFVPFIYVSSRSDQAKAGAHSGEGFRNSQQTPGP